MRTTALGLVLMILTLACQSGGNNGSTYPDRDGMYPSMDKSQSYEGGQGEEQHNTDQIQPTEPKIIRNGSIIIKVYDVLKSKVALDAILAKYKAFIGNEQFDNSDYSSNYHIQIRVPVENLDALVADLETLDGDITNKSINATDVTEEYIDLETRLANKRAYLEQYRTLLKTAKTVEDILKVREQIRVLEEEIESVEGRLKFLSSQVSLSTLDLTLIQEKDFVYRPDRKINFFERLKASISSGWYGFIEFCLVMIGLWPFWLVAIVIILVFRKYVRQKRKILPPN